MYTLYRNYRLMAYQQYTAWSHYFEVLGNGIHRPINIIYFLNI